jgi:hypothetical protein
MRCAQAGGEDEGGLFSPAVALPIVSIVENPPVAAAALRAPSRKLSAIALDARLAAWLTGRAKAVAPARATPVRPDATPAAPRCPAEARL